MSKESKIVTIFVGLVLFQIGWHWFLTLHNNVSGAVSQFYSFHNAHSRKGVAGYLDIALPAVVIGLLLGRTGWQWSFWKRAIFTVIFAAVLVALRPVYMEMLTAEQSWWWPKSQADLPLFFVGQSVEALLLLSICVYGGRLWRIDTSSNESAN